MTAPSALKTAVVTGSSGGIGGAVCSALRAAGYRVTGCDLHEEKSDCDLFLQLDLRDLCVGPVERQTAVARVRATLAGQGLTLLVNNAAVQALSPVDELTDNAWRETLDVNLLAPFWLTQGLLPDLEDSRGSVVNIASVHAVLTKPRFVAYATSKAALVGLTRSMAVDLGGRIRVNAVLPAATATPMLLAGLPDQAAFDKVGASHPSGRIARPEEVASAVVYLASDAASFVTGAALSVDGGVGARLHDFF